MEKKICGYIFAITFVALSTVVHGQGQHPTRSPSVEPTVEIDMEGNHKSETGYDFTQAEAKPAPVSKSRVPANIVSKEQETTPTSMIGPIIFLIALPIGLWIVLSKKFDKKSTEKTVDYYPKTHQFKPFKTDYHNSSDDDDDVDFPKAS